MNTRLFKIMRKKVQFTHIAMYKMMLHLHYIRSMNSIENQKTHQILYCSVVLLVLLLFKLLLLSELQSIKGT